MTTFGDQVFQHGGSPVGMPVPLMGSRAKAFFVDPARGSDGNRGRRWDQPLATVTKALSLCTDKAGDVIYLLNDGNTSGTSRDTATIAWSLDNTHLVGICAPTNVSQRARISPPTSATAIVTPQLTVSGNGNSFWNVSLIEGTSENSVASIGVQVSGARNYFNNVAVMNMADASNGHSGDEAGSAHVYITGGEENVFESCYIGMDTAARSAANASVRFDTAAARNTFKNCFFPMFADAATPVFVDASSNSDIDRWALFERCKFVNPDTMNAVSTITQAFNVVNGSNLGGVILLYDNYILGATDIFNGDSTSIKIAGFTNTDAGDVANMLLAVSTDKAE